MVNSWTCTTCFVYQALTLKALVKHVHLQHASQPNFKIRCGVQGCQEEYNKINSLRKYLRRQHHGDLSPAKQPRDVISHDNHDPDRQPPEGGSSSSSPASSDDEDPYLPLVSSESATAAAQVKTSF